MLIGGIARRSAERVRALVAGNLVVEFMTLVTIGLVTGCTVITPQPRTEQARQLALEAGWQPRVVVTNSYALMSFGPKPTGTLDILTVYIEGDGHAWVGGRYPSHDPTPLDPLALRLAMAQPDGAAVYLARPCQYLIELNGARCLPSVWTGDRFAGPIVDAMNQGLDQVKLIYGAKELVLVGYSGGARIALELAARRQDIAQIITVAGNLDPQAWAVALGLLPLTFGMDNASLMPALQNVPQLHLVGDQDAVVPMALTEQFVTGIVAAKKPEISLVQGNSHACCWVEQWPVIWRRWSESYQGGVVSKSGS